MARAEKGAAGLERPVPAIGSGGAAWRIDVGGDSFALLECPEPCDRETLDRELTPAQAEVAHLMAAGHSNAEIARRRGTSPRTVANQAASVFRRLGVASRLGLVAWLARAAPDRSP